MYTQRSMYIERRMYRVRGMYREIGMYRGSRWRDACTTGAHYDDKIPPKLIQAVPNILTLDYDK